MKTWVRKSLNVGVLSAGFLLVTGGAAHADWTTGPNAGIGDGNQLDNKLQVPVDVSGNALGLLGFANAQSGGGAVANTESANTESANSTESWTSGYNAGLLNGNQLSNTIQVPIDVSGNAVSLFGFSSAQSGGGAVANTGGMHHGRHGGGESATTERGHRHNGGAMANGGNGGSNWTTGYNAGLLNGNQASNTIQVPIDLCGNAIAVAGFANASCAGGAWANTESASTESAQTEDWTSGFNAGVANGNQISNVIQVPINVCGNSIAVLGFADASCGGGAVANTGGMGNGMGGDNGHGHGHGHGNGNGGWDGDGNGAGNGNDGYDDGTGNSNGGYGGTGNSNGGYDHGTGNSNGGYDHGTGNANGGYGQSAGANSMGHHKKKHVTMKASSKVSPAADEHSTAGAANADPYGDANAASNGYNAGANGDDNYGDGNGAGNGNGNGSGNGNGNGGGHHRRHHGGGNGNGGANANAGSCGDWTTGYNAGLLNGNQVSNTVQLPINISGNAISVLGFSSASSQGGAVANAC